MQEVLTSDAHPVVRNAVENKISALLGSPVSFSFYDFYKFGGIKKFEMICIGTGIFYV